MVCAIRCAQRCSLTPIDATVRFILAASEPLIETRLLNLRCLFLAGAADDE